MKKNLMIALLIAFLTLFFSGVSLAILTPVADGHRYYHEDCYEDFWGFYCDYSSYIDNGIEISNDPSEGDANCCYHASGGGWYSMSKTGIVEFNILSKKGVSSRGEMGALLSLTVKAGDLTSDSCLRVYNMQDVDENGEISVKDNRLELIEEICEDLQRGDVITLDVTSILEHDLFDQDQTAFSGFLISPRFYGLDSIEFFDHKNFVHAPKLSVSPSLCPVTAIYGYSSKEAELLRSLRDNVLSTTAQGRKLIKLYYQWSPEILRAMEHDEDFKEEVMELIDRVLELIGE